MLQQPVEITDLKRASVVDLLRGLHRGSALNGK